MSPIKSQLLIVKRSQGLVTRVTRATPRDTEIQPHTQQVVITPTFSPAEYLSITTTATSVLGDDEVVNTMPGLGAGMLPRLHTTGLFANLASLVRTFCLRSSLTFSLAFVHKSASAAP